MALSDAIKSLQEFDLGDLDFDNVGSWPMAVKVVISVLVFLICMGLGYRLHLSGLQQNLAQVEQQETKLKSEFKDKAGKAANLDSYRKQMEEMEETFGALVRQLPSDTEVPGLLEDITNRGVASGLEFKSIDLQPERAAEFYVELPIKMVVKGTYHDLGAFVSGIAGLPRIVTLHDFGIEPGKDSDGSLTLSITAKTYRYNEENEEGA